MKNVVAAVSIIALLTGCVSEIRIQEKIAPISGDLIRSIEGPTDEGGGARVSGIQTFRGPVMQDSQFFAGPGVAQTGLGAAIQAAGIAGGAALLRPSTISGSVVNAGASATAKVTTKSLNQQQVEFHTRNPLCDRPIPPHGRIHC